MADLRPRLQPLRVIDRYLIREILPSFVLALLVFTFIIIVPFIIELAEKFIALGVDTQTVLRVMGTLLPQALALTIPMALLLALLIGLGRLSADREWVALQACGVSLYRLLWPIGLLAVAAWAATSYVLIVAKPSANQTFREIEFRILAERAEGEVKPRVFFNAFTNLVLYVRDVAPDGSGWRDVFVADSRQNTQPIAYLARKGRILIDREKRTVAVILEQATSHKVATETPDKDQISQHDSLLLTLDPDTVFPKGGPVKGDSEMSIAELKVLIAEMRRQGMAVHNQVMEIQKKFSIPIACLVFGALGLALGASSRRDGKLASFVLGIAVIFAYYVIMWTGMSMAKGAVVSPGIAPWLPNIFLGAAGVALVWWRARATGSRFQLSLPQVAGTAQEPGASSAAKMSTRLGAAVRESRPVVVIRIPHLSIPRPKLLDLYVTRQYLTIFGLAFAGFLGIFYISTFVDLSDKLFKGQATAGMLLGYFWYATPQFVYFLIPLSVLVSALVSIGLLTKNSELVVMKACGVSLYRVAAPLFLVGAVASGTLYYLGEYVAPFSNQKAERLRHLIKGGSPQTFDVMNRKWMIGHDGNVYHYLGFDPVRNELSGLSIFDVDQTGWRLVRRTFVTRASYKGSPAPEAEKAVWFGSQGWVREFDAAAPRVYRTFNERYLSLEAPEYFKAELPEADRMTYRQLRDYIEALTVSGFNVVPYLVSLHRKVAFPFISLIMTLIAVPFAVTTGTRGALYGVGVGIVLALVYWTAVSVFAAVGSGGVIPPVLAAWSPNILFGAAAAYLLLTART
ncbi:MAG: LptF/LptG family permease [Acidobacteria bacterium]|nr:LptF/LptG family permease [Acidobacteriota bacterium]MBI3263119.1 LptF/LptG family permease [Acidobacteriota bacterium]